MVRLLKCWEIAISKRYFWPCDDQLARLQPLSPNKPRGVGLKVISGSILVIRNGVMWKGVPAIYRPPKTLRNRFVRWSKVAAESNAADTVMIDASI